MERLLSSPPDRSTTTFGFFNGVEFASDEDDIVADDVRSRYYIVCPEGIGVVMVPTNLHEDGLQVIVYRMEIRNIMI